MQQATNKFLHLLLIMFIGAISIGFAVLSVMLLWSHKNYYYAAIAAIFAILFFRSIFSVAKNSN